MYQGASKKWEETIYKITQSVVNIYIDGVLLNPKFLLDFKFGQDGLFEDNLELGSIPSQYIEMKIHKSSGITSPSIIKIEYGILINNSLTVTEVNKMLVCDVNNLNVKSLSKYDNSFEMIPIGIYNVDDYNDEDDNVINIKALDNIIKLDKDDGYYNAKELIDKNGYATLGEIAQDICNKKGLELATSSFLNSDEKVSVYDNQLKARQYMSYIAEKAEGIGIANRTGKIEFRKIGQDTMQVPLKLFKTYKFGEEYKVSKVAYEDGIRSFKYGDETRNTLWIRQDNLFVPNEAGIKNIYDNINGLTINSFEGTAIIDPRIDIGDILLIGEKPVIYQGEMTLNKRFIADIKSKISIKQKQETTTRTTSQKIINRRVQSEINQINGTITQLVEEQNENSSKISQHTQDIDSITNKISATNNELEQKTSELKQTIDGLNHTLTNAGGNNIFYYAKEFWTGETDDTEANIEEYTDTDLQQNSISGMGYIVNKGTSKQKIQVKNDNYVISFKYKKLVDLATGYILLNGTQYNLTATEWTEMIIPENIDTSVVDFKIISDTDDAFVIFDLMGNIGTEKQIWTQNPNETRTDTVSIGKGIQVNSSSTNTYTRIDADGNRTFNSATGEVVMEATDKGVKAKEVITNVAQIGGILVQEIDGQTWISSLL